MRDRLPMKAYLRAKRGKYKYSKHYFRVDGRSFCFWPEEAIVVLKPRTIHVKGLKDPFPHERPFYRLVPVQSRTTEREFVCVLAAKTGTSYGAAKSIINLFWGKLSDLLMSGKTFDLELSKKYRKEV